MGQGMAACAEGQPQQAKDARPARPGAEAADGRDQGARTVAAGDAGRPAALAQAQAQAPRPSSSS